MSSAAYPDYIQATPSAPIAIGNAWADVAFATTVSSKNITKPATDNFQVAADGWYKVSYTIYPIGSPASDTTLTCRVRINDTSAIVQSHSQAGENSSYTVHNGLTHSFVIELSAGDYLTLQAKVISSGSMMAATSSAFSVEHLGASPANIAEVHKTSNQSASASWVDVSWDSSDLTGFTLSGGDTLVAGADGIYLVGYFVGLTDPAGAGDGTTLETRVQLNGSPLYESFGHQGIHSSYGRPGVCRTFLVSLESSDEIVLQARNYDAATGNYGGQTTLDAETVCSMFAVRLSPAIPTIPFRQGYKSSDDPPVTPIYLAVPFEEDSLSQVITKPSDSQFKAPYAGLYEVAYFLAVTAPQASIAEVIGQATKNSAPIAHGYSLVGSHPDFGRNAPGSSFYIVLAKNDVIDVRIKDVEYSSPGNSSVAGGTSDAYGACYIRQVTFGGVGYSLGVGVADGEGNYLLASGEGSAVGAGVVSGLGSEVHKGSGSVTGIGQAGGLGLFKNADSYSDILEDA